MPKDEWDSRELNTAIDIAFNRLRLQLPGKKVNGRQIHRWEVGEKNPFDQKWRLHLAILRWVGRCNVVVCLNSCSGGHREKKPIRGDAGKTFVEKTKQSRQVSEKLTKVKLLTQHRLYYRTILYICQ